MYDCKKTKIWIHPEIIYSRLSRLSTARGSITGLVPVGPTKVKAFKSVLFTEAIFAFGEKKYL